MSMHMSGQGDRGDHEGAMSSNSTDGLMPMSQMAMVFFTSSRTPLYSSAWDPSTDGSYAGTCIFLIALAAIMRFLLAMRPILEERLWRKSSFQQLDKAAQAMEARRDEAPGHPAENLRRVGGAVSHRWSGWRVGSAAARATYELTIAGVGYLLMLAVMTMNVGYFLSVLAGVWLGTFILGDLSYDEPGHC